MAVIILLSAELLYFSERAPLGLHIGPYYVGGKSHACIEGLLINAKKDFMENEVTVTVPHRQAALVFELQNMGIFLDVEALLEELKSKSAPFNYRSKMLFLQEGLSIPLNFQVNEDVFNSLLGSIEEEVNISSREASVWAEGGTLQFRPHRTGRMLQAAAFRDAVISKLLQWPLAPLEVELEVEYLKPQATISYILLSKGIKEKIAATRTKFNPANENRVHNIRLAAAELDNMVLAPGDIFSFNQIIGRASLEEGFKEAPVIVNDRLVMGPGGGICQVSSTIYNTALLAGVSIQERHNHGLPVSYIPPGRDAAVAYDYLDLKFKNCLDCHVLVHTEVHDDSIEIFIFGDPQAVSEIKVMSQGLQKIPPPVHYRLLENKPSSYKEKIQEGKEGFSVETVRVFYEDGVEIYREKLGRDYYAPTPTIYGVGTLPQ